MIQEESFAVVRGCYQLSVGGQIVTVPNWASFMVPVLHALEDGLEAHVSEIRERVAEANMLGLTPADMLIMTRKRRRTQFEDRVHWAGYYMYRAGLLNWLRRGVYQISEEGRRVLHSGPGTLEEEDLQQYPSYMNWKGGEAETDPLVLPIPEPPTGNVCSSCRYFDVLNGARMIIDGVEKTIDDEFGNCRAHPPTVSANDTPAGHRVGSTWPIVRHDDWCGEWDDLSDEESEAEPTHRRPPTQRQLLWP